MMRCAEVRRKLEQLADGDLDRATQAAVRAHIRGCQACSAAYDDAVSLPARLRALASPAPPPSLIPLVMSRLASGRRLGRLRWALLVPEALLVGFIMWYVSGPAGLADLATSTAGDVSRYLAWTWGLADPPVTAATDGLLTLALAVLARVSAAHLAVLVRGGPRRTA
jgi:predicted anti-sigma-YlaC factor YlaD